MNMKNLATKIKSDSKLFWSYERSKLKTKGKLGQLEIEDGTLTNDSQVKDEVLSTYFASVFVTEDQGAIPEFDYINFYGILSYTDNLVAKLLI